MQVQLGCYFLYYIFFTVNAQSVVAIQQVKILFFSTRHVVNLRFQLPDLSGCFYRCFENENHFCDKVVNRLSKLLIDILNPSVKPISIIFSKRVSDSL